VITELELDRILDTWLAEGAEHVPAEDLSLALRQVDRTRQRRSFPAWRVPHPARGRAARFSLGVVVTLLAVSASWTAIRSVPQDIGAVSIDALDFPWAAGELASDALAFTAVMPAGGPEAVYWRVAAYDRFDLQGWTQTVDERAEVPAGGSLLRGSAEAAPDVLTKAVSATIRRGPSIEGLLISPGTPVRVDADARVRTLGADAWLAAVEVPATTYTVEARVLRLDESGIISPARLRAAGSDYPGDVAERYTAVPAAALGPKVRELLAEILSSTPSRDPYDIAVAIESYLRGPDHFRYDVTPAPCDNASLIECFAQTRSGYCLHYASTMAILLRSALPSNPVPTRLVQGFLPGERSGTIETVSNRLAHAWVEVYFAGVGWIPFDPTGGAIGRPSIIPLDVRPSGPAVP